ncbi:MAG: EscU/YscU/HrcU family type III secretion system export apparatus switch protein [Myxococcota bacterium]
MEKTEKPTPHRLRKAREEGQSFTSRPLETFVKITIFFLVIIFVNHSLIRSFQGYIAKRSLYLLSGQNFNDAIINLLPIFLFAISILILFPILDVTLPFGYRYNVLSSKRIFQGFQNYFKSINPAVLISKERFVKLGFTLLKVVLFWAILFFFIKANLITTPSSLIVNGRSGLLFLAIMKKIILAMVISGLVIGVLDMIYERHKFMKNLYMTKQEVKEEFKNQEGDPEIKAKQKRFRNMILFSEMKRDVKRAKFLLVNPTHIAIPVIYEEGDESPSIGYIGTDNDALKMIQYASLNMVPVVKNIHLARNFYKMYEAGDEIGEEHFEVVASIISLITALEGKIDYIDMDN